MKNLKLKSKEEILKGKIPIHQIEDNCHIYFLIKNDEVVYVGQSTNVKSRIRTHTNDKEFDSFFFIKVNCFELDKLELHYIIKFKPKLNKYLPSNNRYKKLSYFLWMQNKEKYSSIIKKCTNPVFGDYYDGYKVNKILGAPKKHWGLVTSKPYPK